MNINKNFLTEVIKYLISKGVTVHDVLDTFNEHFNTLNANDIKREHEKQYELRKPITDIDLLLCGKSIEENSTPCEKVDVKPVSKSWIDYPKNSKNHGNGVSPARKALFDVVGDKTVIEHLRANGIDYKVYDNRVRRKWSVADACTTPLAPRGRHKSERVIEEPGEPETAVIIPDSVKVVEETSPKTKMMLVNGRMTEIKVSDTDLVQSSIAPDTIICLEPEKITGTKVKVVEESSTPEKPAETLETETKTLETKTETLETESNTEKATESVTNATELNGNNVTAVILDTPNPDAIRKDKDDNIEKALKKFVTHTEESKKDKKPKEVKKDYTVADVCFKLNVTTHELRDMVSAGEFPQPDCGKKWSVKLLKEKNLV